MFGKLILLLRERNWWWLFAPKPTGPIRFTDASETLAFEDASDAVRFTDASEVLVFEQV